MSLTMPEDLEVSNFVSKPGQFHAFVASVDTQPKAKDGRILDAVKFGCVVLAGTEADQARKTFNLFLNNPNLSHRDGGAFATKLLCRMLRACNALPQAAPGQAFDPDWHACTSKQIVVFLKKESDDDFVGLDGAHIYHVNDKDVAHVPKDAKAMELAGNGQAPQQTQAAPPVQQPQQQPAPAASNTPDLSSL